MTHAGISRGLKNSPLDCLRPAYGVTGLFRLAVSASACAPWAGLALCDRCACSGSLHPPQAALAFAANPPNAQNWKKREPDIIRCQALSFFKSE